MGNTAVSIVLFSHVLLYILVWQKCLWNGPIYGKKGKCVRNSVHS